MYMHLPHWLDLLNMNIVEPYFMCTKKGTITHGSAKNTIPKRRPRNLNVTIKYLDLVLLRFLKDI